MTSTDHPQRGVVAVIAREDRLLVIRRSQQVVAPGKFCFPGGGIKSGEGEAEALVRECREELGVACRPIQRIWQSVTPWNVALSWWLTDLADGTTLQPRPEEIASTHWLRRHELRSLDGLLESNVHFLEAWKHGEFEIPLEDDSPHSS